MRSGRVSASLSHVKTLQQGQFQGSPLSLSKVTKLTPQIKGTCTPFRFLPSYPLQQGQGKGLLVTV